MTRTSPAVGTAARVRPDAGDASRGLSASRSLDLRRRLPQLLLVSAHHDRPRLVIGTVRQFYVVYSLDLFHLISSILLNTFLLVSFFVTFSSSCLLLDLLELFLMLFLFSLLSLFFFF